MRPNTPVKIYVAAPWVRRADAQAAADVLRANGYVITRDWWNHEGEIEDTPLMRRHAVDDVDAVEQADAVVVLNLEKSEGKAVETGVAIAHRIPVVSVGNLRPNIFSTLTIEVETLTDAIQELRALYPRQ